MQKQSRFDINRVLLCENHIEKGGSSLSLFPGIPESVITAIVHHFLCFILRDPRIAAEHIIAVHDLTAGGTGCKQKIHRHDVKNAFSHLQTPHRFFIYGHPL